MDTSQQLGQQQPFGGAGATPHPRSPRRTTALIATFAVASALIGGGAGAAATLALDDSGPAGASTPSTAAAPSTSTSASTQTSTGVEQVAKEVTPSVVLLQVQGNGQSDEGSGVVVSADGDILTNNHVVAAAADGGQIKARFSDGSSAQVKVLGTDPATDLAVVKATGVSGLKPAQLGSSSGLQVGQPVVAIGAPLGLQGTVTSGIVSALDRPVSSTGESGQSSATDAVQTDAPINPGNSGGPLVDMSGRVIGIDSAIASLGGDQGQQSGSIGLGFAIPIDQAKRIAHELATTGSATHAELGVTISDSSDPAGALVRSVSPDSAASQAGLQADDVLTKVGDQVVDSADALVAAVRAQDPDAKITVGYVRDGSTHTTTVTLGTSAQQS